LHSNVNCCNHSAGVALECAVHHERNVREEKHCICVARSSNNRVIAACDLYCCLLPQCEALRTCRSGFSDRNTVNRPLMQLFVATALLFLVTVTQKTLHGCVHFLTSYSTLATNPQVRNGLISEVPCLSVRAGILKVACELLEAIVNELFSANHFKSHQLTRYSTLQQTVLVATSKGDS